MRLKFRYANFITKLLVVLSNIIKNAILPRIILISLVRILSLIGFAEMIDNDIFYDYATKAVIYLAIIFMGVYILFPKGVFVKDDYLIIARYTVTLTNWKPLIKIKYDDIEQTGINYTDLRFSKRHFSLLAGGDYLSNIEIVTKKGRHYYFCINDQQEFCDYINKKIGNVEILTSKNASFIFDDELPDE